MENREDLLTIDMLRIAAKRIRETGGTVQKTKMPKRRTDHFAQVNRKAERLITLFNR